MLKREDTPLHSPSASNGSQTRVTPEELSAALAAIEARRQEEATYLAGTIPIDQAVSELHLDATPDEILTEVQKQRATAASEIKQPGPEKIRTAPMQAFVWPQPWSQIRRWRIWRILLALVFIFGVLMIVGRLSEHPLSTVRDGTTVYADDAALLQISEGKPATQTTVSTAAAGKDWSLTKAGGHIYLRGYIEGTGPLQSLQGKPLNVYSDDSSHGLYGDHSKITLCVDGIPLQKSGGDEDYSEVTVLNFQPDPLTTLTPG